MADASDLPLQIKTANVDLMDLLNSFKKDIFLGLNCHAIATVNEYDPVTGFITATMNYGKVYYKKTGNNTTNLNSIYKAEIENYPILTSCPTVILGGGKSSIRFPIVAGDQCLILFNDRDIDNWIAGASSGAPNTGRLHSFSDAMAIVGFRTGISSDTDRTVWQYNDTKITLKDKIKLTNSAGKSLLDCLQELITNVNALVTQTSAITVICSAPASPSSVPVNAAAITAISTQLNTTLTDLQGLLE